MSPFVLTGALNGTCPLLLASPHSGMHLPAAFLARARLPVPALRRMEDLHVGKLLAPAAALGVPLLEATHSRAVIDLNRAEDELDPEMFDAEITPQPRVSDRVRRGYGLFPRLAGPNQPIHASRLSAAAGAEQIDRLHRPWHAAIAGGLAAARSHHGYAVLLDIHSMPSLEGRLPAQLVLGDLGGRSAAPALVEWLHDAFTAQGLRVARNVPYAGGHITERHGQPQAGVHTVQLEFDRALYMHAQTLRPHAGFAALAATIGIVMEAILAALPGMGLRPGLPLAAE